jgi:outer membrane protein TolC
MDAEQQLKNELTQLLGIDQPDFLIDTTMILKVPILAQVTADSTKHPLIQLFRTSVDVSNEQAKLIKKQFLPAFTFVGLFQTRASGFESSYATNQEDFSKNYFDGIKPTRSNYLLGVGVTWNITQAFRSTKQLKAQEFVTKGLAEELDLINLQLKKQQELADTKMQNALFVYREAPIQVKAAADAYLQQSVLYRNGLSNLVAVTQASYTLIRSETDRDIAVSNIWQALLLKAAAAGDYSIFESQL